MPEKTISTVKPSYELTVGDLAVCFREKDAYATDIMQLPVVKSINVKPDVSSKKIYASGKVYDITTNVRGSTIGLNAVALPKEFDDKSSGAVVKGAVSYDKNLPQQPEFGMGYWCDLSDGSKCYYWHPRCKRVIGETTHETSEDKDIDPSTACDVEVMPTDEGVWRVRYYTKNETAPMSFGDFIKSTPYTIQEIEAAGGTGSEA